MDLKPKTMKKTEEIKVEKAKVVKPTKKSTGYAIKAVDKHVKTIEEQGYLSMEGALTIREEMKKATEAYIKKEYGI